jgi:hypothetical protein
MKVMKPKTEQKRLIQRHRGHSRRGVRQYNQRTWDNSFSLGRSICPDRLSLSGAAHFGLNTASPGRQLSSPRPTTGPKSATGRQFSPWKDDIHGLRDTAVGCPYDTSGISRKERTSSVDNTRKRIPAPHQKRSRHRSVLLGMAGCLSRPQYHKITT